MASEPIDIVDDAAWQRIKEQLGLIYKPRRKHIAICVEFLSQCVRTDSPAYGPVFRSSYKLKHIIERWAGDYIHERECILAAKQLGLVLIPEYSEQYKGSYALGVTQKSVWEMSKRRREAGDEQVTRKQNQ
jgi:hypothetical protein